MKIRLKRFTSHEDSTIELPKTGLVVVTGPNGSGKSALIEGIATAFWGKAARGARWSGWRKQPGLVTVEDDGLLVERRWTGKSKTLQWTSGATPDHDTPTKAQESLDTVVGPFEVWRRTCVFSSSDAAHFTLSSDAERKDLLESLLGLGWFEVALAACRKDLRSAQTIVGHAERERDVARASLDSTNKALRQAQAMLDEVGQVEDAGLARVELSRIEEHLRDIASERRELQAQLKPALQAGGAERARADAIIARLDRLAASAHCYACGQPMGEELRARLNRDADDALVAAQAAKFEAVAKVKDLSEREGDLEPEEIALRKIAERQRDDLARLDQARGQHARCSRLVKEAGVEVVRITGQLDAALARAKSTEVDVAELEACERVLGIRGARAHLLGRTLSGIEQLANVWLARLSFKITVQLRPYTEQKSGKTVDSISLTLVGVGGDGVGDYTGASAGERRRVDVALLMSLAELASGARGGATWQSPIFFDEVFDGLDDDGREAVMEVMVEIAARRCVVLITHDERLATEHADVRLRIDAGRIV